MPFSVTKLLRDNNKNLEHLFGGWKTYQTCFFMFTPSIGVEHFLVDLDGRHVLHTPSVGATGIYGAYMILILRA